MFKFVHKLLSSFKIRARISEIRARIFHFVFANSCTNSYANSHVNFVHEIRTKFVIFDKLGKSSYEFARIREGYVTNGLYCISVHCFWKSVYTENEFQPITRLMTGGKKISVSVHTDFQKLVYTEKTVSTEN